MTKKELKQRTKIINRIKKIIENYGTFGSGEIEQNDGQSVAIGVMGSLIALAEYFKGESVNVEVYDTSSSSSDSIHSYSVSYEDLKTDELEDIAILCDFWEADQSKTLKRIED